MRTRWKRDATPIMIGVASRFHRVRIAFGVEEVAWKRLLKGTARFRTSLNRRAYAHPQWRWGGRQIQIEDPDGNPIELFESDGR